MKKENSNLVVFTLVFLSLFIGVLALFKPVSPVIVQNDDGTYQPPVGGQSGQDQNARQFLNKGMTEGEAFSTSTTAATYTVVDRDLMKAPTVWKVTPNVSSTWTIGSTSTKSYVPNIGNVAYVYLKNASTTDAATLTFAAADAGMDIQGASTTLATYGNHVTRITFIRISKYVVSMILEPWFELD